MTRPAVLPSLRAAADERGELRPYTLALRPATIIALERFAQRRTMNGRRLAACILETAIRDDLIGLLLDGGAR
jgi:hypothetical protein